MPRLRGVDVGSLFGTYVLPGRIKNPAIGISETMDAERIGLGSAWVSERFGVKEAGVICGAMAQATNTLRIAGTVYAHNRHPITTASLASTMQAISGNRFILVIPRGTRNSFEALGLPDSNYAFLVDIIDILRRLWAGERVSYSGPAGTFPDLKLADCHDGPPPPIILTATGPKTMAFAGAHCDGVILQPFLTPEGLSKAARIARLGAERAGRDPAALRIYGCVVVAPDLPEDEEEAVVGGRAVSYFRRKITGRLVCDFNGWDPAVIDLLLAHPSLANSSKEGAAGHDFPRQQLVEASRVLPREWLAGGGAIGTAAQCAAKLIEFLDAGADEIILHGSAPRQMSAMIGELRYLLSSAP